APRPVQSICREHETGGFVPRQVPGTPAGWGVPSGSSENNRLGVTQFTPVVAAEQTAGAAGHFAHTFVHVGGGHGGVKHGHGFSTGHVVLPFAWCRLSTIESTLREPPLAFV